MSTGNADYEEFIRRSREAIAAAFTTLKAQNPSAGPIEQESSVNASSKSSVPRVLSRKRTQCCPSSDESTSSADSSADAVSSKGIVDESLPRTNEIAVSRKRSRPSLTRPIPNNISVQETQRVEVKQANEARAPETPNALRIKELQTKMLLSVQGEQCVEMTQTKAQEDQFNKPETNPILVTATKLCRPATARTVDVVPQTDKNKKNETNDGDPHLTPRPRIDTGMRISDARMRPLGPDFVEPGEFDVICDRGNLALKHPGNLRLKSTIESKLAEYAKATSKTQKTFIVTSIVDSVRDANGGFVKCKNGEWFEVGDFLAREKIGQWYVLDCALLYLVDENVELGPLTETCRSLRDTLHMMYKSSTKAKRARMAAHKKVKPLFAVPQIVLMPKHEDGTYLYFDTEYPNGIAEAAKTTGDMLSFTPTLPGPSEIARFAASLRSAECDVDYPTMHYVPGPYGPFR
jgi:hypothetical protein